MCVARCWLGVLGARASPPPSGVGFVCDEVCLLRVAGRAGAEAGCGGGGGKDALFVELWKACAGPLSSVPPLGEKVYYFPQGHIEQVRQTTRVPCPDDAGAGELSLVVAAAVSSRFFEVFWVTRVCMRRNPRRISRDRSGFRGLEGFRRGII